MADSLRHRGPDAAGYFDDSGHSPAVALVHRRLSIIDLSSAANQPIGSEDGSIQVALNGEIYNFRELRERYCAAETFRSSGDAEVVAHLYRALGEEVFSRLDGMFALAIWDGRSRRLVLATDPFGKKPLYYWSNGREFLFASEIKALLAGGVPAEIEPAHIPSYLAFGCVPSPDSLFRGMRKLAPASCLRIDGDGIGTPTSYWDLQFPDAGEELRLSEAEANEELSRLLSLAVKKRLISDVPLGVLLSGGIDSSVVAALMKRVASGPVKTFCVGFAGHSFYDERPHAQAIADHIGTEHFSSSVEPDAAHLLERLLHHHDEPFGDSSALPTYLVAQEARKHVTVVLNGDGGDEAFAGYERFHAAVLSEAIPGFVRQSLSRVAPALPAGSHHYSLWRRGRRFLEKAALPLDERVLAWSSFFDRPALSELLPCGDSCAAELLRPVRNALEKSPRSTLLSKLLYFNARTYLLDDLLPKMDRMTMAHGLEARSPFLDRPLVEWVARLPDHFKRRGRTGKVALKRLARDLLPQSIIDRPKHGFGVPLGDWFRSDLKTLVEDHLQSSPRVGRFLDAGVVGKLVEDHMKGSADHGHKLWTLLTLEVWLRKHNFG